MEKRFKYPRTPHLPGSPGASPDDIRAGVPVSFRNSLVVVTEKMDGENTTLYRDGLHARSIDGRTHPSRTWVKALHGRISYTIPVGYRVCGENLFAQHSLRYENLASYFMVFSVWDNSNECLSWEATREFAGGRGLECVRTLYEGEWRPDLIASLPFDATAMEGFVVRASSSFRFDEFGDHVAKWVRRGHVQTDSHWMHTAVVPNGLAPKVDR
ncbi:MAG: RNA ligase family protein [Myxococcota bacterium]